MLMVSYSVDQPRQLRTRQREHSKLVRAQYRKIVLVKCIIEIAELCRLSLTHYRGVTVTSVPIPIELTHGKLWEIVDIPVDYRGYSAPRYYRCEVSPFLSLICIFVG